MVRGSDVDAAALEVVEGELAEFLVEHAEDFGGDVVDCDLVACQPAVRAINKDRSGQTFAYPTNSG